RWMSSTALFAVSLGFLISLARRPRSPLFPYRRSSDLPEENLIGGREGLGFVQLMMNLPLERLSIGVAGAAAAQAALDWTVAYTKDREAFGQRIIDFQNTRFKLADVATTVDALWAYVDRALLAYKDGKLSAEEAAKVKFWATEREWEVLDTCVQLH